MSVSKALERLLRIRRLEVEQRRLKLEAALARLQILEHARHEAAEMERQGRARVIESASSGELADRVAGLVQSDAARARMKMLEPRIASAEIETFDRRREFLEKRVERRQAATLIEQATARDELEQERGSRLLSTTSSPRESIDRHTSKSRDRRRIRGVQRAGELGAGELASTVANF